MAGFKRGCAAIAAGLLISGSALPGQTPATGRVMREKLRYSQELLEGLMTSDFNQLSQSSQALIETTKLPAWAILNTPEYDRYTQTFLKSARNLKDAAVNRDSDGAFMAYMSATMSCYQCHKYIKAQRIAR
jgi:hypothetical protein